MLKTGQDKHTLNLRVMKSYRDWDWINMRGSAACLKWGFRDLQNLEAALPYVPRRDTVVQAGGNLGLFPKRLAEEFSNVITFEPDPTLFAALVHNAPESNITAINAAVGQSRDSVSLSGRRRDTSGRAEHEGLVHISGRGRIRQMLIDDLELETCDLIYLDIEGYELNALIGASGTIDRLNPVIGVEINRNIAFYGSSANDIRSWIVSRGYRRVISMHSDEVFIPC